MDKPMSVPNEPGLWERTDSGEIEVSTPISTPKISDLLKAVNKLTHERDALAEAIHDAAVAANLVEPQSLTGPQLLLLCKDFGDLLSLKYATPSPPEVIEPEAYSNATAVDLEKGSFDFSPSPVNREQFPKCPHCNDGRMADSGDGSNWCDRCEVPTFERSDAEVGGRLDTSGRDVTNLPGLWDESDTQEVTDSGGVTPWGASIDVPCDGPKPITQDFIRQHGGEGLHADELYFGWGDDVGWALAWYEPGNVLSVYGQDILHDHEPTQADVLSLLMALKITTGI